jgi:hypothetical protein
MLDTRQRARNRPDAERSANPGLRSSWRALHGCQPTAVRVAAETGWLPSTTMVPSAAIVTA